MANKIKLYKYNRDIKCLLKACIIAESIENIDIKEGYRDKEELRTNLYYPILERVDVKLMIDRIKRNVDSETDFILQSFFYALERGDLSDFESIEAFEKDFYMKLGSIEL